MCSSPVPQKGPAARRPACLRTTFWKGTSDMLLRTCKVLRLRGMQPPPPGEARMQTQMFWRGCTPNILKCLPKWTCGGWGPRRAAFSPIAAKTCMPGRFRGDWHGFGVTAKGCTPHRWASSWWRNTFPNERAGFSGLTARSVAPPLVVAKLACPGIKGVAWQTSSAF